MDDVIEIGARAQSESRYFSYTFSRIGDVNAVEIGIVEIAALDAPDFVVHLLPFGGRIDVDFHIGQCAACLRRL